MDSITQLPIQRITPEGRIETEDTVVRELPLTIFLNGQEMMTLLCSPSALDDLAVGFLFSEGIIKDRDEIGEIAVDAGGGVVRVSTTADIELDAWSLSRPIITSAGKKRSSSNTAGFTDQSWVESGVTISAGETVALVNEFQRRSAVFQATGGVHSAALCNTREMLVFADDIGRHNAIDKVLGHCLLRGIATDDGIVLTSGRIPSEILLKVARARVPIIVSVSAPTDLGVRLADGLGITVVGFVRGDRMNVYTHADRIT
jgi:FdhD protein